MQAYLSNTRDGLDIKGTVFTWRCKQKEEVSLPLSLEDISQKCSKEEAWEQATKAFDSAIEAATEYNKIAGAGAISPESFELRLAISGEMSKRQVQLSQARTNFGRAMLDLFQDLKKEG